MDHQRDRTARADAWTARRPAYVVLGTNHRYYIQFTDGRRSGRRTVGRSPPRRRAGEVQTVVFGGGWDGSSHKSGCGTPMPSQLA